MHTLRTLLLATAASMALSACLPPPHHDGPGRHGDDRGDRRDDRRGDDRHDDHRDDGRSDRP
ncbi:MAG: hypothetical protein ABWX87_02210 [Pseudoxanthomonas sp.]|jgi:hypothetical protein